MDFWSSAKQAAERAASLAKEAAKKGLEAVEATAEEANRKLNLNLHDKVGAGKAATPPSAAELEAFGLTPEFAEFVRTLNYSAFRDFPAEHLLPASGDGGSGAAAGSGGAPPYQLNPWQVRHATLVVEALKEVNELRFVLCPKYMTDEHFWHIYFTLARKHLPDRAFSWGPDDTLPTFAGQQPGDDAFSLSGLGSQLMQLGSKLQSASQSGRQRAGLELSSLVGGARGGAEGAQLDAAASGAAAGAAAGGAAAGAGPEAQKPPSPGMLEEDPDLEAYLQVAIGSAGGEGAGGSEGAGGEGRLGGGEGEDDDDLDLDSYINELSAEVEAAAAAEGAAAAEAEGGAAEEGPAAAEAEGAAQGGKAAKAD